MKDKINKALLLKRYPQYQKKEQESLLVNQASLKQEINNTLLKIGVAVGSAKYCELDQLPDLAKNILQKRAIGDKLYDSLINKLEVKISNLKTVNENLEISRLSVYELLEARNNLKKKKEVLR